MKAEAHLFKSLAGETRLKILWLLLAREERCVCDFMVVLGITQSRASRRLRHLYHLGRVSDRCGGVWMNYRLCVATGSAANRQWQRLAALLRTRPEAEALKERLEQWPKATGRLGERQDGAAGRGEVV